MSESSESIVWKILTILGGAVGVAWAVIKYALTGKKKESYEGEKIKEETSGLRFEHYIRQLDYLQKQVLEMQDREAKWKAVDELQRQENAALKQQLGEAMQRIENLKSELMTAKLKGAKFK